MVNVDALSIVDSHSFDEVHGRSLEGKWKTPHASIHLDVPKHETPHHTQDLTSLRWSRPVNREYAAVSDTPVAPDFPVGEARITTDKQWILPAATFTVRDDRNKSAYPPELRTLPRQPQQEPVVNVPAELQLQPGRVRTDVKWSLSGTAPLPPPAPAPAPPPVPAPIPVYDMAIGIVLFNFTQSVRVRSNYFTMRRQLDKLSLPVFTLELVLEGQEPQLPGAFVVRTSSWLFHKERLCRILETKIPRNYTKICFMDADILFQDRMWYQKLSDKLNTHTIVQPFSHAKWYNPSGTKFEFQKPGAAYAGPSDYTHPGFAWGFQRSWYKTYGFYDYAISGAGDTLSVAAWFRNKLEWELCRINTYKEHLERMNKSVHKVGYIDGEVHHLWHGSRVNRQYISRHSILEGITDLRKILKTNKDGVYELTNRAVNQKMKEYFMSRDDDGKRS
jgi:hypothetical protein